MKEKASKFLRGLASAIRGDVKRGDVKRGDIDASAVLMQQLAEQHSRDWGSDRGMFGRRNNNFDVGRGLRVGSDMNWLAANDLVSHFVVESHAFAAPIALHGPGATLIDIRYHLLTPEPYAAPPPIDYVRSALSRDAIAAPREGVRMIVNDTLLAELEGAASYFKLMAPAKMESFEHGLEFVVGFGQADLLPHVLGASGGDLISFTHVVRAAPYTGYHHLHRRFPPVVGVDMMPELVTPLICRMKLGDRQVIKSIPGTNGLREVRVPWEIVGYCNYTCNTNDGAGFHVATRTDLYDLPLVQAAKSKIQRPLD